MGLVVVVTVTMAIVADVAGTVGKLVVVSEVVVAVAAIMARSLDQCIWKGVHSKQPIQKSCLTQSTERVFCETTQLESIGYGGYNLGR